MLKMNEVKFGPEEEAFLDLFRFRMNSFIENTDPREFFMTPDEIDALKKTDILNIMSAVVTTVSVSAFSILMLANEHGTGDISEEFFFDVIEGAQDSLIHNVEMPMIDYYIDQFSKELLASLKQRGNDYSDSLAFKFIEIGAKEVLLNTPKDDLDGFFMGDFFNVLRNVALN